MGTPLYNAPEQIRESHRVDGRADLYSLGAVMYHLVTGRPPFEGKSVFEVQLEHVNRQPDPSSTVKPGVPSDWDEVILKALQKDPDDRFASAEEMEQALELLRDQERVDPEQRLDVLEALADLLTLVDRANDAHQRSEEAMALAATGADRARLWHKLGNPALVARAECALGATYPPGGARHDSVQHRAVTSES